MQDDGICSSRLKDIVTDGLRAGKEYTRKDKDRPVRYDWFFELDSITETSYSRRSRVVFSQHGLQHSYWEVLELHDQDAQLFSQKYTANYIEIEDLQWRNIRKYKNIFEFICNKYELTI
jgi:hypothetical protein